MHAELINLHDFETRAKEALPDAVWNRVEGGAEDEITLRRNREAFERLTLRPRVLLDVAERDLSVTVLGRSISFPVMLAPAGTQRTVHPDGELAAARAAGAAGTIMALGTSSSCTIEEVAGAATGPLWFQLYHYGNELTPMLIERAEAAGYCALCVTADVSAGTIVLERERRDGYRRQLGVEYANFTCEAGGLGLVSGTPAAMLWERPHPIPITWSDIEWFRSMTTLPIVLKGVMTAEDARTAVEHGIEAIIVSNHGGRTLDCQAATIDTLPEVVHAVEGRCEVYVDGGIRRGTDVLKALALGADAVLIGRPLYWGLAVDGETGVKRVLDILRDEMDRAMAYAGRASVASIDRSLVERPDPTNG